MQILCVKKLLKFVHHFNLDDRISTKAESAYRNTRASDKREYMNTYLFFCLTSSECHTYNVVTCSVLLGDFNTAAIGIDFNLVGLVIPFGLLIQVKF